MSSCSVCRGLDPTHAEFFEYFYEGGLYYYGEFAPFLQSAVGCQSCSFLFSGLLHFFSLSELENDSTKSHRSQLSIRGGKKSLEIGVQGDFQPDWQTFELYVLPGLKDVPWKALKSRPHWHDIHHSAHNHLPAWLDQCITTHAKCCQGLLGQLPTRVIDVGNVDSGFHQRLYVTKGEIERYICLSHCWGGFRPVCTTSSNIEEHQKSMAWHSLPKTFQEAIELPRFLNIRYLWIDSLCIVQDDLKDWERESAAMASVYSRSYLTISAAAAADCSHGLYCFPNSRPIGPYALKVSTVDGEEVNAYITAIPEHRAFEAHGGVRSEPHVPLLRRAWCFQEHILSPRVIQFGPQEIVWECKETLQCPCERIWHDHSRKSRFEKLLQTSIDKSRDVVETRLSRSEWTLGIVPAYSSMLLTHPSDRLVAISGVARVLKPSYKSDYLAGLWKIDLLDDLCWRVDPRFEFPQARPKQYIAPSWSWAAVNCPVNWQAHTGFDRDIQAEVVHAHCKLKTADPFGAVSDGSLTVRGALVRRQWAYKDITGRRQYYVMVIGSEQRFDADFRIEVDLPGTLGPETKQDCFLLRLATSAATRKLKELRPQTSWINFRALVLTKRGSDFERIGYLDAIFDEDITDWFEGIDKSTITIV